MLLSALSALTAWAVFLVTAQFSETSYKRVFACNRVEVSVGGGFVASILVFGLSGLITGAFVATIALSRHQIGETDQLSSNVVARRKGFMGFLRGRKPLKDIAPPLYPPAMMAVGSSVGPASMNPARDIEWTGSA